MGKIYVIYYKNKMNPGMPEPARQAARAAIAEVEKKNPGLKFHGAFCDMMTGIGVSEWEGPSPAPIEKALKAAGVAFDAVVAVDRLY